MPHHHLAGAIVGLLLALAGAEAAAQASCMGAPGLPENVTATLLPARDAGPGVSAAPAALALAWEPPIGARERPGVAPAAYVVEAGSGPGFADIAAVETHGPVTRYTTPLANGTYYVRLRARNACGTSGPTAEFEVPVRGSASPGTPNPLVLLDTVNAVRERLVETAFIRVMGRVRNGWRAAPAAFVEVTAVFDGPAGEASTAATTFVDGTSGRLAGSGLVTDTVLQPGAAGCFVLFARFPAFQITGVRLEASAEALDVSPLDARVGLEAEPTQAQDEFGDLVISGGVVNEGEVPVRFGEVRLEVTDAEGRVVDCDVAPIRPAAATPADGVARETTLEPGGRGTFATLVETVLVPGLRVRAWTTLGDGGDRTAVTPAYQSLQDELRALLVADEQASSPQSRAALRNALRRETREIERSARER